MGQRMPVRGHFGTTPHCAVLRFGNPLEAGVCYEHTRGPEHRANSKCWMRLTNT